MIKTIKSFDGEDEAKRQQNAAAAAAAASRLDHLDAKAFSSDQEEGSGSARGSTPVATRVRHA